MIVMFLGSLIIGVVGWVVLLTHRAGTYDRTRIRYVEMVVAERYVLEMDQNKNSERNKPLLLRSEFK